MIGRTIHASISQVEPVESSVGLHNLLSNNSYCTRVRHQMFVIVQYMYMRRIFEVIAVCTATGDHVLSQHVRLRMPPSSAQSKRPESTDGPHLREVVSGFISLATVLVYHYVARGIGCYLVR